MRKPPKESPYESLKKKCQQQYDLCKTRGNFECGDSWQDYLEWDKHCRCLFYKCMGEPVPDELKSYC